jgi:hypothetical protein
MDDHELDTWLRRHDEIVPSSGFAGRVMEAVHQEASALPPIAFPWSRALPGLVVLLVTVAISVSVMPVTSAPVAPAPWMSAVIGAATSDVGAWLALAVCLTILPVFLSMKLARSAF